MNKIYIGDALLFLRNNHISISGSSVNGEELGVSVWEWEYTNHIMGRVLDVIVQPKRRKILRGFITKINKFNLNYLDYRYIHFKGFELSTRNTSWVWD